jgi:hypothetical protein
MKEHFTDIKTALGILLLLVFHVVTFNSNLQCRLFIVKDRERVLFVSLNFSVVSSEAFEFMCFTKESNWP